MSNPATTEIIASSAIAGAIESTQIAIENLLRVELAAPVYARLKKDSAGYYKLDPENDAALPLLTTYKTLLNFLTALKTLVAAYENYYENNLEINFSGIAQAIWRGNLNPSTINASWRLLKELYTRSPELVNFILTNVFAQLDANNQQSDKSHVLTQICLAAGIEAPQGAEAAQAELIEAGITTQAATIAQENSASSVEPDDFNAAYLEPLFKKAHDFFGKSIEHIKNAADAQTTPRLEKNKENIITVLQGLSDIYHEWRNWRDFNTLNTLFRVYQHTLTVKAALAALQEKTNLQWLLSSANSGIKNILITTNEFLRELTVYLEFLALKYGLDAKELFKNIEPLFIQYNRLVQAAGLSISAEERYPYALAVENQLTETAKENKSILEESRERIKILEALQQALIKILDPVQPEYDANSLNAIAAGILLLRKLEQLTDAQTASISEVINQLQAGLNVSAQQASAGSSNQGWISWLASGAATAFTHLMNGIGESLWEESPLKRFNETLALQDKLANTLAAAKETFLKAKTQQELLTNRLDALALQKTSHAAAGTQEISKPQLPVSALIAVAHNLLNENATASLASEDIRTRLGKEISACKNWLWHFLEKILAPEELDALKNSSQNDTYTEKNTDLPVIKIIKSLLNILTSLEGLSGSLYDFSAYKKLYAGLKQLDQNAFKRIWSLFGMIYDDCPRMFQLITDGVLQGLNETSEEIQTAELAKKLYQAALSALDAKQAIKTTVAESPGKTNAVKEIFNKIEHGIETLQNLEQDPQYLLTKRNAAPEKTKAGKNPLISRLDTICEIILSSLNEHAREKIFRDRNGYFQTLSGQETKETYLENIKNLLNTITALKEIQQRWSQRNGNNDLVILAQIFASFRRLKTFSHKLDTEENRAQFKESLSVFLTPVIRSMGEILKYVTPFIEQAEIRLGLKESILLAQIQPIVAIQEELKALIDISPSAEEGFPYLEHRKAALVQENKKLKKQIMLKDFRIDDMERLKEIMMQVKSTNHHTISGNDRQFIIRNLANLDLTPDVKQACYEKFNLDANNADNIDAPQPASGFMQAIPKWLQAGKELFFKTETFADTLMEHIERKRIEFIKERDYLTTLAKKTDGRLASLARQITIADHERMAEKLSNNKLDEAKSQKASKLKKGIKRIKKWFDKVAELANRWLGTHGKSRSYVELPVVETSFNCKGPSAQNNGIPATSTAAVIDEGTLSPLSTLLLNPRPQITAPFLTNAVKQTESADAQTSLSEENNAAAVVAQSPLDVSSR